MTQVLFESNGPVGHLILNAPEHLNAIDPGMADQWIEKIRLINASKEIRVVIVRGAGRAFSSGGRLQFILDHIGGNPIENQIKMKSFYSKFLSVRKIKVPTIAMIHGAAVGAGLCLALACDLRIASIDAKLSVNFAKIGLSSGMGGLYFLNRVIGPARAAELLFTGKTIGGEEALRIGLLNEVCDPEKLDERANALALEIAANSPDALKWMKQGLQKADRLSLEEIFEYESEGQALSFLSDDLKEGISAVQSKRKPNFKGT